MPQATASGLSGSPTLATKRKVAQVILGQRIEVETHEAPNRRGRRIPNVHLLLFEDAVPALGVELRFVDDHGHAVTEWGADAIGGAGDPARIGRAPVDVVRV